jgi:hypothetical protein
LLPALLFPQIRSFISISLFYYKNDDCEQQQLQQQPHLNQATLEADKSYLTASLKEVEAELAASEAAREETAAQCATQQADLQKAQVMCGCWVCLLV